MAFWNLTNYTTTRNMYEVVKVTNDLSKGVYGLMLIISIWVVLFIGMKRKGYYTKQCLAGATFPCMILSLFLKVLGLLQDKIFFAIMFALAIIAISFLFKIDSSGM